MTILLRKLLQSVFLLLAVFKGLAAEKDKVPYKVMLPEFDIKAKVANNDVDFAKFQDAIEGVTSSHLDNYLDDVLPPKGHFSVQNFQGFDLDSRLLHVFLGDEVAANNVQKWLVQASFSGSADFVGTQGESKAAEEDQVKEAFRQLLMMGLQDEQFSLFEKQLLSNEVLSDIESVDVIVDGEVIATGGSSKDKANEQPSSDPKRKLTKVGMAAAIIFGCFVLMLTAFALYWYRQRKRKRRMRELARKRSKESTKTEDSFSPSDAPEGDRDGWMDEWTKKITSIPLRDSAKPLSSPTRSSRRGHQNRINNHLGSITEEGSVSESSVSSAMSDEEEVFGMKSQSLADFDLRYSTKSKNNNDRSFSIGEIEEGSENNDCSLVDFDLEYSVSGDKRFDLGYSSRSSQGFNMLGYSLATESMFNGEDSMDTEDIFNQGDIMSDQPPDDVDDEAHPHQFADVDTASPEDYEPRVMQSSMLFL